MEDKNTGRWIRRCADGTWLRKRTMYDAVRELEALTIKRKAEEKIEVLKRSLVRAARVG